MNLLPAQKFPANYEMRNMFFCAYMLVLYYFKADKISLIFGTRTNWHQVLIPRPIMEVSDSQKHYVKPTDY